jgi:hypothetical protein
VVLDISKELVKEEGYYNRTKKAAALALEKIRSAHGNGELNLEDKELMWLDKLSEDVDALPSDVQTLTDEMLPQCEKLDPSKYDMESIKRIA